MTNIFLVTSAINSNPPHQLGAEDRIKQTLHTVSTIKTYAPGSYVILIEGGQLTLNVVQRRTLLGAFDDVLDFTHHPGIRELHTAPLLMKKSPCEALIMREAVALLPCEDGIRYFKISGRYQLTAQFNIVDHNQPGKYVFLKRPPVVYEFGPGEGTNVAKYQQPFQYSTRLYSFCGSIVPQVHANLHKTLSYITTAYSDDGYTDLEHATYYAVNPNLVHEVQTIGVGGIQAENLQWIQE